MCVSDDQPDCYLHDFLVTKVIAACIDRLNDDIFLIDLLFGYENQKSEVLFFPIAVGVDSSIFYI